MKIYFWGLLYGEKLKKAITVKNPAAYAVQKFNHNLVDALRSQHSVKVVSPVCTNERIERTENTDDLEYEYIKYFGKVGRIKLFIKSFICAFNVKDTIMIADALNLSMVQGMMAARIHNRSKIVLTVTDVPEDVLEGKDTTYARVFLRNLDLADGFIFLTEQTNRDFNKSHKPYIIIEGIAQEEDTPPINTDKKICVYAGGLAEKYYIRKLVDSFNNVAKANEELYIFGDGECKQYVKEKAKTSGCIKYMGTMDNKEILKYEAAATLLINPRPNIGDYTKYSFPSKLIEYMNSGTPALVNRLDGVPEEYYENLFLFSGYEDSDFQRSIRTTLDLQGNERQCVGNEARRFIRMRNGMLATQNKINKLINDVYL